MFTYLTILVLHISDVFNRQFPYLFLWLVCISYFDYIFKLPLYVYTKLFKIILKFPRLAYNVLKLNETILNCWTMFSLRLRIPNFNINEFPFKCSHFWSTDCKVLSSVAALPWRLTMWVRSTLTAALGALCLSLSFRILLFKLCLHRGYFLPSFMLEVINKAIHFSVKKK